MPSVPKPGLVLLLGRGSLSSGDPRVPSPLTGHGSPFPDPPGRGLSPLHLPVPSGSPSPLPPCHRQVKSCRDRTVPKMSSQTLGAAMSVPVYAHVVTMGGQRCSCGWSVSPWVASGDTLGSHSDGHSAPPALGPWPSVPTVGGGGCPCLPPRAGKEVSPWGQGFWGHLTLSSPQGPAAERGRGPSPREADGGVGHEHQRAVSAPCPGWGDTPALGSPPLVTCPPQAVREHPGGGGAGRRERAAAAAGARAAAQLHSGRMLPALHQGGAGTDTPGRCPPRHRGCRCLRCWGWLRTWRGWQRGRWP